MLGDPVVAESNEFIRDYQAPLTGSGDVPGGGRAPCHQSPTQFTPQQDVIRAFVRSSQHCPAGFTFSISSNP